MPSAQDQKKTKLIDKVVGQIQGRLEAPLSAQAKRFVREYFRGGAPEDLLERSAQDLYGAALAHWSLARRRQPGERLVRVYNPRMEEHGWQSTHTVMEIVQDDMPFLVDSTRMELNRHGLTVHLIVHPVMRMPRDDQGQLQDVFAGDAGAEQGLAEAIMHFEVDRVTNPNVLQTLESDIHRVLDDVRAAVEDWPALSARLQEIVSELGEHPPPLDSTEVNEGRAFLQWLDEDHFTYLGYREYHLERQGDVDALAIAPSSGLGILRTTGSERYSRSFAQLPSEARELARKPELLVITKSNTRASVHRPGYMDYIGIKKFGDNGAVVGEHRFLGLYTSSAYQRRPLDIPLLRLKVRRVMHASGLRPVSHSYKTLLNILETLPRDELFQGTEEQLFDMATGILHLQERQRVRLLLRRDPYGRFLSCLVYLPRERFNTQVRLRVQDILRQAFNATAVDFTVWLSESVLARLYMIVHTEPGSLPEYDVAELESSIVEASRSWEDDLHDSLIHELGEERGNQLFARYRSAFPASYREDYIAAVAVHDVMETEQLGRAGALGMALYHPLEAEEDMLRFKLFHRGDPVTLSVVLPMLENMGVQVVDERPHEVKPSDDLPVWIHDIGMRYRHAGQLDTEQVRGIFQDAFARVWNGVVENDGFNRLVLRAHLPWRQVAVLRAYCKYLLQTGFPFSQRYVEQALTNNPRLAALLANLFIIRFDPRHQPAGERTEQIAESIREELDSVPSLDEDRILRRFLRLIEATLRTNYFRDGGNGGPLEYLSLKLDPREIPDLPDPRPAYEIFVYSPRVEGVHLRGGKVARGGIRWSDRREDFRTEIFGLMKAQMVKNAVIVPVGAKGGFVVKRPPPREDRDALKQEVVDCYSLFIRALLDVTDNLQKGRIVPPPQVVRHDDDDPYLVVAADKGTATFSDTANAIAQEYDFWLGDAFASGGSSGYDHKKMGITARGAWESVKRHFRELGKDIQREDFSVAGIGDMSGDVFGNGMLLSRHIRLVGAFDHRHIFIDPDPDPEASYTERERLFRLPRSSWADYDEARISEGGGVYPRSLKSISLSPQARAALGIDVERLTPNELVRALLTAPVDLLWNGGIGTFVKAAHEPHEAADDRTNDATRVDAEELRCKVVGEGGNLGLTYEARIAYARNGGRTNTDFIDNSGGVDCSDHEVNIKILLDEEVKEGELNEKQRNRLLEQMTDEVAGLVLRNNYLQTEALSVSEQLAPSLLDEHIGLIRALEKKGRLQRATWHLPDDEAIEARRRADAGLTRPELSVLMAYAKIDLYDALLDSDVCEDAYLGELIVEYFPGLIQEHYPERIRGHRLRREIVATYIANSMINRMGITFPFRLREHTGAEEPDVARAFMVARRVFSLPELWQGVADLDNRMDPHQQMAMLVEIRKLASRSTLWFLRNRRQPLDVSAEIEAFAQGVETLRAALPDVLQEADLERQGERLAQYQEQGVPQELAVHIAALPPLSAGLDITEAAAAMARPVEQVAWLYFKLGEGLRLRWLRDQIGTLPMEDHWPRLARTNLRSELLRLHRILAQDALEHAAPDMDAQGALDAWQEANAPAIERYLSRMDEFQTGASGDLALLSVALDEVRKLLRVTTVPGA